MTTTTYTAARQNFKSICDQVCYDCEPIIIKRRSGDDVVIVSLTDFRAMDETSYLLKNPANAKFLQQSIKQSMEGKLAEFDPTLS